MSRDEVLAGSAPAPCGGGPATLHDSEGCEKCDQTGFRGRAGVHELMECVYSASCADRSRTAPAPSALPGDAMKEGMRTLRQDGVEKVLAANNDRGTTSGDICNVEHADAR